MRRRKFLQDFATSLVMAAMTPSVASVPGLKAERVFLPERKLREKSGKSSLDMKDLAGQRLKGDLFELYLGQSYESAPERIEVDFPKQLKKMWDIKARISGGNAEIKTLGRTMVSDYEKYEPERTSVQEYVTEIERIRSLVLENLDWSAVAASKFLPEEDGLLLRKILESLSAKDFLAISMTELMPTENGEVNLQLYKLLLESAGREFIESIPALDRFVSFGTYQFTKYALDGVANPPKGASNINNYLKGRARLPKNVSELRGKQHHLAAILNSVDNAAALLQRLRFELSSLKEIWDKPNNALKHLQINNKSGEHMRYLNEVLSTKPEQVAIYIATAHHAPGLSAKAFVSWVEKGLAGSFKDYFTPGSRLVKYVRKTESNRKSLEQVR